MHRVNFIARLAYSIEEGSIKRGIRLLLGMDHPLKKGESLKTKEGVDSYSYILQKNLIFTQTGIFKILKLLREAFKKKKLRR